MQYDFGALWGQADMTAGMVIDAGNYDAVVEKSEWGVTKLGDKGAWTIKFRITTGPHAAVPLTMTMSVSPVKQDGEVNSAGLGIMYRQLGALGIPVPPNQPFWALGWTEQQVAQAMTGKPCMIRVVQDEYDGRPNNKVRGIDPPRPGAPTDWPRQQQQQQGSQFATGGPIAAMPGQFAANGMALQQGYGQWQQTATQPAQGPGYGQSPQGPYGQPNAPWNPMAQQQQQPQQPGTSAMAQPGPGFQPGQGGTGEFTQQGQSQQPWMPGAGQQQGPPQQNAQQGQYGGQQPGYGTPPGPQPGQPSPWNAPPQQGQNPYAAQAGAYGNPAQQQQPQGFPPSAPGWAQGQPQQQQQGPQGFPPQGQQQQPQGGPEMPPWAQ
jgi:hypothetical protein